MWKKTDTPVPIDPSQVVIGLYVWLDVPWAEHPFLTSRVMVKTARDVALLQEAAVAGKLYYHPERSEVTPPPPTQAQPALLAGAELAAAKVALSQELKNIRQAKKDRMQQQRDAAARLDKEWEKAARETREALLHLTRSPKAAGEQLGRISREAAHAIAMAQHVLLHLLGEKNGKGPQFHALNTMTLSLLLGRQAGMPEHELADLAMAALAHDAGKAQIPVKILQTSRRKKFEEDFFRQHVEFSTQFAAQSGAFTREALAIIADHHEAVDGSGYPKGKLEASRGARVLAIVDRFDRLCSPEALDVEPMAPAEALAHMFRYEIGKFDMALLGTFIKMLGVYPPGTVVQLSDTSLAMVVAPGAHSLQPKVLIYSPEVPKSETMAVDLAGERDLKVLEVVRPHTLPPEVRQWLNPEKHRAYHFSVSDFNP